MSPVPPQSPPRVPAGVEPGRLRVKVEGALREGRCPTCSSMLFRAATGSVVEAYCRRCKERILLVFGDKTT